MSYQKIWSKKIVFLILCLAFPFLGAQCIQIKTGGGGTDGGIYKSTTYGKDWKQKTAILSVGGVVRNFSSSDILYIAQDPSDELAIYAGSEKDGLFYSYDGGESWQKARSLGNRMINIVAVDPKNKCIIYAVSGKQLLKSSDCNRTFAEVYRDASDITAFVVDNYNSSVLYLGTSKGTILKSQDGGVSWRSIKDFGGKIISIVLNPNNTREIYVAALRKGLWFSQDSGQNWKEIGLELKKNANALEFRKLDIVISNPQVLYLASKYDIYRSDDKGETWTLLPLTTKTRTVEIYAFGIDPRNANNIYYSTATTFYRSQNGGQSWSTSKNPSSRQPSYILVDFAKPGNIYFAVNKIESSTF